MTEETASVGAESTAVELSDQRRRVDELRSEAERLSRENAEAAIREIQEVCRRRGVTVVPHVVIDAGRCTTATWGVVES